MKRILLVVSAFSKIMLMSCTSSGTYKPSKVLAQSTEMNTEGDTSALKYDIPTEKKSKFKLKMKTLFLFVVITAFNLNFCFGQKIDSLYYDKDWKVAINELDSLLLIKKQIENAEVFDSVKYLEVFRNIYNSHISHGVYYLAFDLVNETWQVYVDKTNNYNSTYTRELMSCLSSIEYMMGNVSLALKYAITTDYMFDYAKDYDNLCYLELQTKLCEYYLLIGDTTTADMKIQRAYDLFCDKCNGDILNVCLIKELKLESILNHLGLYYDRKRNYKMAEKCYKVVLEAYEDNPSGEGYQRTGSNLVSLLFKQKKYEESIQLANKCLDYCNDQYLIMNYFQMLTSNYIYLNDTTNVIKNLYNFNIRVLYNIANHFSTFTETERDEYWSNLSSDTHNFNNWVTYTFFNPVARMSSFEMNAFLRDFGLKYRRLVSHFISQYGSETLKKQYNSLKNDKQKYIFSQVKKEKYYEALAKERNTLISIGRKMEDSITNSYLFCNNINNSITDDEFIIQFTDGEYFITNEDKTPNLSYYTVYLMGKKTAVPLYYFICPKYQVDSILDIKDSPELFYTNLYSSDTSEKLYHLFFEKLEHLFNGAHTIYYSTCNKLSYLNFDLFRDKTGIPLNEKYKMIRISSVYEISAVKQRNFIDFKNIAIFGNIDYGASPDEMFSSENYVVTRDTKFRKLSGTKTEIDNVSSIFKKHHFSVKTYEQKAANEKAFKLLSGNSPDILHIATHGFYLEDDSDKPFSQSVNTYSQKESAMALSGLALSGANNAWKGNFDLPNVEDGILTAYEISQLDLSNTKLVVLSACETARGRIFPVDGVFGLQRAFKQAGAGSILMSLWKVDDNATATFMEYFYKFLFETNDRHEALKMAQDEVKKQYPDPYYWAAWVMLD